MDKGVEEMEEFDMPNGYEDSAETGQEKGNRSMWTEGDSKQKERENRAHHHS